MTTSRFARTTSKIDKPTRGRSDVEQTPISIRSSIPLSPSFEERIRTQLASQVGHGAGLIERGTVRFEDLNGPKGGVDTICRIKLVVSGRPSVIAEKRDTSVGRAFAKAVRAVGTAVGRSRGKHGLRSTRRVSAHAPQATRSPPIDDGELIGRRVGRGPDALARALERPEKLDRSAYVDTSAPGVSASDRRAGGFSTARRNTRARPSRSHSTLEDSRTRPSRKSTRRSANRSKPSGTLERAVAASMTSPRKRHRTSTSRSRRRAANQRT
jgi:hypothetical protein